MPPFTAFARAPRPLLLECGVQHYDWGQRGPNAFIPALLGQPPGDQPWAEMWIGAHPVRPSRAQLDGTEVPLPALIDAAPSPVLGDAALRRFGPRLPFLLKVLAAERMLSIQAHPNREQAREGFAREEAQRIPRDAAHRNYRDDSHKPELIVALTAFHALCGFRPEPEVAQTITRHPELASLGRYAGDMPRLFGACFALSQPELDEIVGGLVTRLGREHEARAFTREQHEYWLLEADRQFSSGGRRDAGILVMLLLNLVRLSPGQALYLDAGELHSYLEGVGIELMASSDNVLRGGLTSKHVDVAELQKVLTFRGGPAHPIEPDAHGVYRTTAEEFELSVIALAPGQIWRPPEAPSAPALLLVTDGEVVAYTGGEEVRLRRGAAVLVPAAFEGYTLRAGASARVFRATTPPVS